MDSRRNVVEAIVTVAIGLSEASDATQFNVYGRLTGGSHSNKSLDRGWRIFCLKYVTGGVFSAADVRNYHLGEHTEFREIPRISAGIADDVWCVHEVAAEFGFFDAVRSFWFEAIECPFTIGVRRHFVDSVQINIYARYWGARPLALHSPGDRTGGELLGEIKVAACLTNT